MKTGSLFSAIGLTLALCGSAAGQSFTIDWCTIDGGGGISVGGAFEASGTIGQPDAGVMSGGGFELTGGFWVETVPPCPGDLNGDRLVDLTDLAGLLAHFGTLTGATLADGDLDGDGDVDLTDLAGLLSNFGTTCP